LGAVLLSPEIDRNQQEYIQQVMNEVPAVLANEAGYIPNAQPPNYDSLSGFIEKVKPIEANIQDKPALLFQK
jgi:phosphonate transport system substrate-binding protein